MFKLIKVLKIIFPLIKLYPWGIPAIVILGTLASLAEGIGISLLIPFLQNLQLQQNATINNPIFNNFNQILVNFEPKQRILILTLGILFAILLKAILAYIYSVLCYWLQSHTLHKLRFQVYEQLLKVSQSFWDTNKSGQLLNLISQETANSSLALTFLIWLTINVCMMVIFGLFLLFISWQLTLLVTIAFLLISLIISVITRKTEALGKEVLQANINLSNLTLESFTGIKTIRAFGRETYEQKRYKRASLQERDLRVKLNIETAIIDPISEGLSVGILVCIMFITFKTTVNLPILMTFIFMLYRLQPQVQKFNYNLTQIIALSNSVKEVYSLLNTVDKPYIISGHIPFTGLKQGIKFESVNFVYSGTNNPALEDISIFIPQGKTTALVGQSGAGKSTLINLIFRFYDVNSGEIYIDNYPLKELELKSWRNHIAMVSQDVHIFSATIRENIAYSNPEATESEIIEAAKKAHAHEFISELSQGYDTFVGDRGIKLSGGQRQRISIARAILCNPEILILDEATNSLDNISEKLIQESIDLLSKNRTVIVIAHRLSTIENADKIIVFKQGKVVEQGSLNSLIQQNGMFKELYQLQEKMKNYKAKVI